MDRKRIEPARAALVASLGVAALSAAALGWLATGTAPVAWLACALAGLAIAEQLVVLAAVRSARARIAAAEAARDAALARMSHALRTPMNGILGTIDVLAESRLTREQEESVGVLRSSAQALLATLTNLLDHAHLRSGRLELDVVAFELRAAVHEVVRTRAARAPRPDGELAAVVAADVPDRVRGDRRRLQQVLANVVEEAIAHGGRGDVTIRVVTESLTDREAVLAFEIGRPAAGDATTERRPVAEDPLSDTALDDLGLGLAVSAALVRSMGGTLAVDASASARFAFGARFAVDPGAAAWRPAPALDLCEREVLIVDHGPTTRDILSALARSWRARPIATANAREALAALEESRARGRVPAFACIDLDLPGMPGLVLAEILRSDARLAAMPLIALASAADATREERCRAIGCAAVLVKPLLESDVLSAARAALSPDRARRVPAPRPNGDPRSVAAGALRILVADDNPVDRVLAVRLLEKRGHRVRAVGSGEEAVQACASEPFDVVLMDVQMPHVSGLEATAAIRARERRAEGPARRVPILALTADDDRARCIEAGMDGYVAKPVHPQELADALARAVAGAASDARLGGSAAGQDGEPIDERMALEQAGGDRSLLGDLAQMCLAETQSGLERLREAVADGDAAGVRRAAHKLRGSLLVVAAGPAAHAAHRVADACPGDGVDRARAAIVTLEREVDRVRPVLEAIVRSSTGARAPSESAAGARLAS
ncbi:MAG TPA: response regulator [Candidatus Binatia bacterium]|nr:response regulator [Candidatus Binatia bacterium]